MLTIELTSDTDQMQADIALIEEKLQRPDLQPAGRIVVGNFRRVITSGRGFTPVSDTTLLIRASRGESGSTLNVSGKLRRSIRVLENRLGQLTVGSKLRQAGLLRFGGSTSSRSAIPGKKVPLRDYLPVNQRLLDQVAESVLDTL